MNKEKIGQEPAFAAFQGEMHSTQLGMSKRFYAACAAMQGLLANPYPDIIGLQSSQLIEISYEFADELLKQENQQ